MPTRLRPPLRLLVPLLVAGLAAACSPKRVTHHEEYAPAPAPEPEPAARDLPDPGPAPRDLPDPEPRGRTGSIAPRTGAHAGAALGHRAAQMARAQLGKPYQWGAAGPEKFDCSGLVCWVYGRLGVPLPRVSRDQARSGDEIAREDLAPGDLVFFATEGRGINHVGIYIGRSEFVHAPRRHVPVRTDSLNDSYWRRRFRTARRVS